MRRNHQTLFACFLIAVFAVNGAVNALAQSFDKKTFVRGQKQAETIRAEWLKDYLAYVASDEMEGRDTPSRGLDLTAKFIALNLKQWGVKPAGDDGTYFQKIALRQQTVNPADTFVEFGGRRYEFGKDFISGLKAGKITDAPLVFLKQGWIFKAKNINPYKTADVRGKVVVMSMLPPPGITQADVSGQQGVDYQLPLLAAKEAGALAVLEIPSPQSLNNWQNQIRNVTEKGGLAMEKFIKPNQIIPSATVSASLLETIFAGEKISSADALTRKFDAFAAESFAFSPAKKISLNVAANVKTIYTQNVVGVVEGSDSRLKDEYVAFGAHYDHIGILPNPNVPDRINNGADDDGSGTVSILAMARAYATATPRPKRSALFV